MRLYRKHRECRNDFESVREDVLTLLTGVALDDSLVAVTLPSLVQWTGVQRSTLARYLDAMKAYGDVDMYVYKVEDGGFGEARLVTLVALPAFPFEDMPETASDAEVF